MSALLFTLASLILTVSTASLQRSRDTALILPSPPSFSSNSTSLTTSTIESWPSEVPMINGRELLIPHTHAGPPIDPNYLNEIDFLDCLRYITLHVEDGGVHIATGKPAVYRYKTLRIVWNPIPASGRVITSQIINKELQLEVMDVFWGLANIYGPMNFWAYVFDERASYVLVAQLRLRYGPPDSHY